MCSGNAPDCCTGRQLGAQAQCVDTMALCAPAAHAGRISCNQNADCPGNQTCCVEGPFITCADVCLSTLVACNGGPLDCPAGQACTGGGIVGRVTYQTCEMPVQ
jgi:hypothetical protein